MAHNNKHAEEYYHIHVYCILLNHYSQDDVKEKRRTKLEEIDMPRARKCLKEKMSEQNALLRPSNIFLINPIKYLLPSVLVGSHVLSNTFYISW